MINWKNIDDNIIRHDYLSRTLINLIKKFNLNEAFKLINYTEYINENKIFMKKMSNNLESNNLSELIKLIKDLNLEEDNKIKNDSESE